jgi:hypothetical protein
MEGVSAMSVESVGFGGATWRNERYSTSRRRQILDCAEVIEELKSVVESGFAPRSQP